MNPIGVVFCGISHSHARAKLQVVHESDDFSLLGIFEPKDEARAKVDLKASPFAGVRWFDSLDAAVGAGEARAVICEGYVHENFEFARAALQAGKHVHLEKPGTLRVEEFRELADLARAGNRILQLGYQFRYMDGFRTVVRIAKEGVLGDVFFVRGRISSDKSRYERQLRELRGFPGGVLLELGCHLIDQFVLILGRPGTVTPFLRTDYGDDPEYVDNGLSVLEYPRAMAVIEAAAMESHASARRVLEVQGTNGTVVLSPLERPGKIVLHLDEPAGGYDKGSHEIEPANTPRHVGDFAELAECIRAGREPTIGLDHELATYDAVMRAVGLDTAALWA